MTVREARIMGVRAFRAEVPDEPVIVIRPDGSIRGSWTPGTAGIDRDVLAQVMGLSDHLKERVAPTGPATVRVSRDGTTTTGLLLPRAAPKPGKKR